MKQAIRLALDPNKHLKTHIMATVGPSTKDFEVLKAMVESGVTFFRFNGAHIEEVPGRDHLSYEDARKIAEHIRGLRRFFRQSIGIYFDLGGPKIRVKHVLSVQNYNESDRKKKDNWLHPTTGETVIIHAWNQQMQEEFNKALEAPVQQSTEQNWDNKNFVQKFFSNSGKTQHNELMLGEDITTFKGFDINNPINLKDGWCRLKIIDDMYLFNWDKIPGNDDVRLIEFLKQNFGIDWVKKSKIKKIDSCRAIEVSTEKNSLSLRLNHEKTKVTLEIDDGRTDEFIVKTENGKLNIYDNTDTTKLICKVEYVDSKFEFRPEQGANPYRHIFREIITEKDKRDIAEAVMMGADIISLSFVCSPYDAEDLRDLINESKKELKKNKEFMKIQSEAYHRYLKELQIPPIFAKIETAYAVLPEEARKYAKEKKLNIPKDENWNPLRAIAEAFDGLMVARGDLAVEVEKYKVPELQRQIIKIAHLLNKPVIVATEMLESMRKGDASTRAEIMDINSAVHQEADILMLSGETANIKKGNPADVVREMRAAIKQAEDERLHIDKEKNFEALQKERENELNFMGSERKKSISISRLAQGNQVCVSARALRSEAIIASVKTGQAVQEIAYYRPNQKIMAITDDVLMAVRLLQYRGIYPVVMERPLKRTLDEFLDIVTEINDELGVPHPYLYNWNKISENDERKFIEFLKQNYSIDWVVNKPKIEKIDEITIKVSKGKKFLFLKLIDEKKKVTLEIDDGRTYEFIVIKNSEENGERNIYPANLSFRFPGLVRIKPEYLNGAPEKTEDIEIPNSIHEFTLPTDPKSVPETERKYVLSKESFGKLEMELKNDAANWRKVKQYNFYFTDCKEILSKKEIMLRIRFEELLDQGRYQTQHQKLSHDDIKIFFTFKKKSSVSAISREETRPEKEFEVTRELRDQIKFLKKENPAIRFSKLPNFYLDYIWDRCNTELKGDYKQNKDIIYKQIAHTTNIRFTFEMWNNFILELDDQQEINDCQLEIELRGDDKRLTNQLDEYIHDKFCLLDIPLIRVDKSVMDKPKYPTKVMQALALAGHLSKSVLQRMEEIKGYLNKRHADYLWYMFSWDEIPGNDEHKLMDFLKKRFDIDWLKAAKIEKTDEIAIKVSKGKKFLLLKLNDEKTKVNLKIGNKRIDEFIAKVENSKLNIYDSCKKCRVIKDFWKES